MRYIDAEALLAKQETIELPDPNGGEYHIDIIHAYDVKKAPTADVVEVRHGEWVVDAYNGDEIVRTPYAVHEHNEPYCSLCGSYALLDGKEDYVPSNFCPRCGAKMDGERRAVR